MVCGRERCESMLQHFGWRGAAHVAALRWIACSRCPLSSPFLYQSLRSRAPQRGPRATWQGLVEERRGKGLGAGNAAAAKLESLMLQDDGGADTFHVKQHWMSTKPCQEILQPVAPYYRVRNVDLQFFFLGLRILLHPPITVYTMLRS